MKYSEEKQSYHVDLVCALLQENDAMSGRAIWEVLDDQGHHFSRSYIHKLVGIAYRRRIEESKAKRLREPQLQQWYASLAGLKGDFDKMRVKFTQLMSDFPRL